MKATSCLQPFLLKLDKELSLIDIEGQHLQWLLLEWRVCAKLCSHQHSKTATYRKMWSSAWWGNKVFQAITFVLRFKDKFWKTGLDGFNVTFWLSYWDKTSFPCTMGLNSGNHVIPPLHGRNIRWGKAVQRSQNNPLETLQQPAFRLRFEWQKKD